MKQIITSVQIILFAIILFSTSCSKTNQSKSSTSTSDTFSISNISGSWIITSYFEKEESKTSSYKGYVFNFASGGVFTATKGSEVNTGTWVYSPASVGYYGSAPTKASIRLSIATAEPLSRLNRTWNIDSLTSTYLSLLNPEPTNQERVLFARN
jgi:hypothetical protein